MKLSYSANKCLVLAAIGSGLAALLHLACIAIGPEAYRFLGAGEQMAEMAQRGDWYPGIVTLVISLVLFVWSLYALSGAKLIRPLPLLKTVLCLIALIYMARGLGFVVLVDYFPENSLNFWLISSGICLVIGSLYTVGLLQSWSKLSNKLCH
ncbi:hypothetical protein HR060_05190 [Catenovulum sp. SM1970]|uniref:hypothetical protein n=1 Tax=Marinifaba aquimaris TaxID=2741323 RepID=UPI0015716C36|nr:hypothetical protein [Marinifaba aquimaris]NTS76257.1 hypothetical protein [Marinifaba aquimaris]